VYDIDDNSSQGLRLAPITDDPRREIVAQERRLSAVVGQTWRSELKIPTYRNQ